jgi:DNA repair protein RadC
MCARFTLNTPGNLIAERFHLAQLPDLLPRYNIAPRRTDRSIDSVYIRRGRLGPAALRIIREAANLYLQQSAEQRDFFAEPDALCRFWRGRIGALPHEVFHVGYLDSGYRLLKDGIEELEEGTVDRAVVYPRRVAEAALRRNAAALVFAHNHPNGSAQPSEQDKVLTWALVLSAQTLQIEVLDHLIVSPDNTFSFRKEGLL